MFGMAKTLIVVYKDEMLINQLKKMVENHYTSNDTTWIFIHMVYSDTESDLTA